MVSDTPEYHRWARITQRCHNPRNKDYHLYGGRGIVVCDKWRSGFHYFLADIGQRPGSGYSLDRRDGLTLYGGKLLSISAIARETGLSRNAIRNRLSKGIPLPGE